MLLPLFLGPLLLPFPGDQGTEAGGGYGSGGGWGQVVLQSRDPNKKKFFLEIAQDKTVSLSMCMKCHFM